MRKDVMMISAGLMMLAMASCDQTEYREITEDRVVPQPVDTIKVADHFYLDGYLSRTSEDIGGRQLNAVNLFSDGEELYVANFAGKCIDVFDADLREEAGQVSQPSGHRLLASQQCILGRMRLRHPSPGIRKRFQGDEYQGLRP